LIRERAPGGPCLHAGLQSEQPEADDTRHKQTRAEE
jgi:hypothetical protein